MFSFFFSLAWPAPQAQVFISAGNQGFWVGLVATVLPSRLSEDCNSMVKPGLVDLSDLETSGLVQSRKAYELYFIPSILPARP